MGGLSKTNAITPTSENQRKRNILSKLSTLPKEKCQKSPMELGESSQLFNQTELIEQIKSEHVRTAAITSVAFMIILWTVFMIWLHRSFSSKPYGYESVDKFELKGI